MKNQAKEFYLFGKAPKHEEPDAEHRAWQRRSQEWADQRRHWDRILDRAGFNRGTRVLGRLTSTVRPDAQTPRPARFMSRPHAAFGDIDLYSSSFFKQPADAVQAGCA